MATIKQLRQRKLSYMLFMVTGIDRLLDRLWSYLDDVVDIELPEKINNDIFKTQQLILIDAKDICRSLRLKLEKLNSSIKEFNNN